MRSGALFWHASTHAGRTVEHCIHNKSKKEKNEGSKHWLRRSGVIQSGTYFSHRLPPGSASARSCAGSPALATSLEDSPDLWLANLTERAGWYILSIEQISSYQAALSPTERMCQCKHCTPTTTLEPAIALEGLGGAAQGLLLGNHHRPPSPPQGSPLDQSADTTGSACSDVEAGGSEGCWLLFRAWSRRDWSRCS